ncbi:MAG: hypothetical protein NTY53_25500 [Kiritimatiellaeota bacterium]|nr:hypothetical protein [Kiritimatiellota bacterium]
MNESFKGNKFRRLLKSLLRVLFLLLVVFLVYFPVRQTPIAFTLATGIGVSWLQARVDELDDKAINGKPFTADEKQFLNNLYRCFAKGGRLTLVLRQSSQLMDHYLSASGDKLELNPRIFVHSAPVQQQMGLLKRRIQQDRKRAVPLQGTYASTNFYMGDPDFIDSHVGLYFGRITATPTPMADGSIELHWRAECPWEWPSYASLFAEYGQHQAQCFPLPNLSSILFGPRYCLRMDDGLGGHLALLGLAKSFLAYAEWTEILGKQP